MFHQIISNSAHKAKIFEGVHLPPDNIIIKNGQVAGSVELTIARGDSDDAAGLVLTREETELLIRHLQGAMEVSNGAAT